MAYTVKVVDPDGTVHGTLGDDAKISGLLDELNAPGGVTITLPTTHSDALLMQPGREVQILDGSTIVFWGPIVRPQGGLVESSWQCQGLLWYFQHRFFGTADRTNLVVNGGFEDGETDWTFEAGVGHGIATDPDYVFAGDQSLELTGNTADHVEHAQQIYTPVTQYHPLGDAVTVSAWVFIPAAGYLGPALNERGLLAVRKALDGTVIDVQSATITDDTPKDEWVQLEVVVPGVRVDDTVEIRLYPPHGTGFFDEVTATLMESLYFPGADVTDVISGIVEYAQDLGPFTHGKSDLNIVVTGSAVNEVVTRVYLFSEHRNIADAILEFVNMGYCDIGFTYTETTRTLNVHTSKGSLFGTTLELDTHVADFTYSWDGDRAATSVVALGPGDGPDRPEGAAADDYGFNGTTLEIIETAPEDVTIGQLDDWAAETLSIARNPDIIELTTMPGAGIIGNIESGDTLNADIVHGWVNITDTYRVVRIEVDPYMDQAKLTLNIAP